MSADSGCVVVCKDVALHPSQVAGLHCRFANGTAVPATYDSEGQMITCKAPMELGDRECLFQLLAQDGTLVCDNGSDSESKCCACKCKPAAAVVDDDSESTTHPAGAVETVDTVGVIKSLSWVDRWLALWIISAMILGVVLGKFVPSTRDAFSVVTLDQVSLPVALGLWFMMWPVLSKVRYEVLGDLFRQKGIWRQFAVSFSLNWIVGPLIMTAFAWATLPDLDGYRNGVILVGLARCIAMVLIWNQLARGHPEFCAVLVAINSVLQVILFSPFALFYLKVVSHQYQDGADVTFNFWQVCRSVLIFLGAPLIAGIITRYGLIWIAGKEWYNKRFLPWFGPVALLALLYTIIVLFALQGQRVIDNIGDVFRIAVPLVMYFALMWSITFFMSLRMRFGYEVAVTQSFTASSNNFELAIAIAAGTFGANSPEALAATIGPLIEVPVLLALVYVALFFKNRLGWDRKPKGAEFTGAEAGEAKASATELCGGRPAAAVASPTSCPVAAQ